MNTKLLLDEITYLIYALLALLILLLTYFAIVPFSENAVSLNSEPTENVAAIPAGIPDSLKVGKKLFRRKCASCHARNMKRKLTGPALGGVTERWENKTDLYAWIKNAPLFLTTGDAYANALFVEYRKKEMTAFPELEEADIDAILEYVDYVYEGK